VEGRQQLGALDEGLHVVFLLAGPMKKLEDEVAIRQLTQGADLVYHSLYLVVVVADAKTTLFESTKRFIKLKDASLMVVDWFWLVVNLFRF
jgi:hypothetical protein